MKPINLVQVREYGRLTTATGTGLDCPSVSHSAFRWLCELGLKRPGEKDRILSLETPERLTVANYVGVIETPCGTVVEILPKTARDGDDPETARRLLRKILAVTLDLPALQSTEASIETFKMPIAEWLIRQLLAAIDSLLKRGVRFEYRSIAEQAKYVRGRLDASRQLRQPPWRQHMFEIVHDDLSPDRPENRLIKAALERVQRLTGNSDNWRWTRELLSYFSEVPTSMDIDGDFRAWRDDRLVAHYRQARKLSELILRGLMPFSQAGGHRGYSMLFPMERVFESYVARSLRKSVGPTGRVIIQSHSGVLCQHLGQEWFQLIPDIIIEVNSRRWVIDTKWKRLDGAKGNPTDKYKLRPADLYQLFAYGNKVLGGAGDMLIVVPKTDHFPKPLPVFEFSPALRLWVVPFDLDSSNLVTGDWTNQAPWYGSTAARLVA